MTTIFGTHWIPAHRGPFGSTSDVDVFARWQPGFIKIITVDERVPYLEDVPPNSKIVVRNHPMSEDGNRGAADVAGQTDADNLPPAASSDYGMTYRPPLFDALDSDPLAPIPGETPQQRGIRHAAICARMADNCAASEINADRLVFEGLNEPHLWSGEPPDWTAQYYRSFLWGLHDHGLRGCVGNFGVGWPGNGGVTDAPVDWEFWQPVINAMWPGDCLGLHEYWALNGPGQNWRWWAGRYTQCPYDVPILITECGIDTGVTGQWYGGWRDLPGTMDEKAKRYTDELIWYANECRKDGRIQQLTPFTYDIGSDHWQKFNIRDEVFLRQFFARQAEWPQVSKPPPNPEPEPGAFREWLWAQAKGHQCISLNTGAALQKAILRDGYTPLGNEWATDYDGLTLVCQLAGRLDSSIERVYLCAYGQWDAVVYEEYRP